MPDWDRYGTGGEHPYVRGSKWDPFNRNKWKGDVPIIGQQIFLNFTGISDTLFRPVDWRIRITPAVSLNYLNVQERGIVNADVTKGTTRFDAHIGLQEAFGELKIKDIGPN